jgi:hypothetical protein
MLSHGKWWMCLLIIDFKNALPVSPVVSNTISRLSLNTSTILCKIGSFMSLNGAGTLSSFKVALFAAASAFDERVTRIILLFSLRWELAVKTIVVVTGTEF